MQSEGEVAVLGCNGVVNRDELGAVGECAFDLDLRDERGDAGHDLVSAEEFAAKVHEIRDTFTFADEFEKLRGDEGHSFGMIEPYAAGEAFLSEEARVVEQELIDFAWREMHVSGSLVGSYHLRDQGSYCR